MAEVTNDTSLEVEESIDVDQVATESQEVDETDMNLFALCNVVNFDVIKTYDAMGIGRERFPEQALQASHHITTNSQSSRARPDLVRTKRAPDKHSIEDNYVVHPRKKYHESGIEKYPPGKRVKWTSDKDKSLLKAIEESVSPEERDKPIHNHYHWKEIASRLENISAKQARERYNNHLIPTLNSGAWTEEEDTLIISAQKALGNKWAKMKILLVNRNEHSIKNRWMKLQRECNSRPDLRQKFQAIPASSMSSLGPEYYSMPSYQGTATYSGGVNYGDSTFMDIPQYGSSREGSDETPK